MNKLVENYLELVLKDKTLAIIDSSIADEIILQTTQNDDVIIDFISDTQATITTQAKLDLQGFCSRRQSKAKLEMESLNRINIAIESYCNQFGILAPNVAYSIKFNKPNSYVEKLGLSAEDLAFFKSYNYRKVWN